MRWSWSVYFKIKHAWVMQAFMAPVLRLGHWEAQDRVYWCKVPRQTEPNHQYFFSHPLNLAYYTVCMGIGGGGVVTTWPSLQ